MIATSCPDQDSLRQLLLGKLSGPAALQLEEHVLYCDRCSATADELSANDELTAAIQAADFVQDDEQFLPEAIERAKQLRSLAETLETDETLVANGLPQENNADANHRDANLDEVIDFLAPADRPDAIGRLGEYRVLEVLGVGGMGVVFRAEDPKLERQIALKAMKPAVAASHSAKDRFLREAKATAAIEHDNIVHIYQVGEDRGIPFIAMQYLRGESLETRLKRQRRLDQREVLRIGREVAAGLEAAHERGLIHRDIKPDNIWLEGGTGRVKIVDFGLVRSATDDAGLTQNGMVLGTPRYMAPEQAQGQSVDHRCDLFSLGSVLYHLTTGKAPFEGSNVTATLIAVVQRDPQPVVHVCPEIDPSLSQLIMRLLSKDPDQRPQSAAEVSRRLAEIEQKLAAEEAERTRQREVAETIVLVKAAVPKTVAQPEPKPQPNSRTTIFRGGAIVTISLSILAGLYFAGVIFQYETKDGTLIVKVSGNDFSTSIQGQQVKIQNTATNETFTIDLNSPQAKRPLKPGSYQFLLTTDSGLTAAVDRFTIRSGRDEVVEVRWEPKSAQVASHDNVSQGTGWHGWSVDAPPPAIAPFDADQAKAYQEAWAKYLGVPVEYTNSIGMKFRLIPPGEFLMGSTPEEIEAHLQAAGDWQALREWINSAALQHKVILTQPVYVGVTEVSQSQYELVMGTNPSYCSASGDGKALVTNRDTSNHPVEMVSWNDAAEFCAKLSQQEALKPFYFREGDTVTALKGIGYRLPTEAEWESACRAGTTTRFWSGDEDGDLLSAGWFGSNSGGRSHAVGELRANPFGLSDVHGNVWEWVQDSWDPASYNRLTENAAVDPSRPFSADSPRIIRGGYWIDTPLNCRSSHRVRAPSSRCHVSIGFRVVLTAGAVKTLLAADGTDVTQLFNGKDLSGWSVAGGGTGNWRVVDGAITCSGPQDFLYSTRDDIGDFYLRAEVKLNAKGDSGIFLRASKPRTWLVDYEVQLTNSPRQPQRTGSLQDLVTIRSNLVPPDTWFTVEVSARGNHIQLWVNGQKTADYLDTRPNRRERGHLVLQHHDPDTRVEFRKLELKEFTSLSAGSVWLGTRTYRQGMYAGQTVHYELHVRQREGNKFIGHVFDNGQGRNRAEVEGEITGNLLHWTENGRGNVLTMEARMSGDVIHVTFKGSYANGVTNQGDGELAKLTTFVRGNWQIDGDVIEQTETGQSAMLLFGSPEFGDGDFTCEAMRAEGDHGLALVARAADLENYYYFDIGVFNNTYHSIYAKEAGTNWRRIDQQKAQPVPTDRWVKMRLRLRGDCWEGYLDDQLVVSGRDDRRLKGYLGLRTWNETGKYRNLQFTDPTGKVLWQGLPSIPSMQSDVSLSANFTNSLAIAGTAERRAAEWVQSVGGKVKVNDQDEFLDGASLRADGPFQLTYVGLGNNDQVTDSDMVMLKDCVHLSALGLEHTQVSDAGLIHFNELRTLAHLYLQGSAVTDEGLACFKNCTNLLALGVNETQVSDASLQLIAGWNKLQFVDLRKTRISEQGIKQLQTTLPRCKIIWDGGVIEPPADAAQSSDEAGPMACDGDALATGRWPSVLAAPGDTVESRDATLGDGAIQITNGHAYDKPAEDVRVMVLDRPVP